MGHLVTGRESTYDVVVVGAGIVGAACAYFLTREGLRVAVLEKGIVGGGATAAGMGHLVAMDDSPAQLALTKLSLQLWRGLLEELPASAEYRETGTLWIATDEEEMAEVRRKYGLYNSMGLACEVLDGETLAKEEPELRRPLAGALRVLGDGVVYPPVVAQFLLREVAERGALFTGRSVSSIEGNVVTLGDGTRVSGGYVVNAAGCSAVDLTSGFVMRKRKGHLIITDRYPGFLRHQVVELGYLKSAHSVTADSVAFNLQPRATGQILIGSSRQYEDEECGGRRRHRSQDGGTRMCVYAWGRQAFGTANLDGISSGDAGQASSDRSVTGNPKVLLATGT